MAGKRKGKIPCGAVVFTKRCPDCDRLCQRERGEACTCGKPLTWACERKVLPGSRCDMHKHVPRLDEAPLSVFEANAQAFDGVARVAHQLAHKETPQTLARANVAFLQALAVDQVTRGADDKTLVSTRNVAQRAVKDWAHVRALESGVAETEREDILLRYVHPKAKEAVRATQEGQEEGGKGGTGEGQAD